MRHVEMAGILQHTKQQNFIVSTHSRHRRRKETEEKAKVVPVIWGTYLNATLTFLSKDDIDKKCWKVGGLVWCETA